MTIEELDDKHRIVSWHNVNPDNHLHTKLSTQFAIDILEEFKTSYNFSEIENKIQELKQYLDE